MNEKPLRIAYLAARNSIHTVRLVNALAQRGYNISLITLHDGGEALDERVPLFKLPIPAPWGYFLNVPFLKKLLKQLQPELLHVHYASGYGTLGRLSQFQPLILSVWGSDIFDFPNQSVLHRALVVKNLRAATQICSTSQVMATVTGAIVHSNNSSHQKIAITPFGIDTTLFYPRPELRNNEVFKIGTVKTLAPKYGIDTLIQAFHQLRGTLTTSNPQLAAQLRLGIAGSGPQYADLQALVNRLELSAVTEFTGQLPHAEVPTYLNQLQIYVAASRLDSESFGVAVLEASACGLPVVVSRVGGLPEVVEDGVSGYIVAKDNVEQLTEVLLNLVNHQTLRDHLGRAGRELVLSQYNWLDNVQIIENIYKKLSCSAG